MEHTKESLFHTCIHCKSNKTFLKALEFYKQVGYEPTDNYKDLKFNDLKSDGYLYVVQFGHGLIYFNAPLKRTVIKLPRKKPLAFPRIMLVSQNKKNWYERRVHGKIQENGVGVYMVKHIGDTFMPWKFAKEIKVIYKK